MNVVLIEHPDKNNEIELSQHRFMKEKSCLSNLHKFFEVVTARTNKGEIYRRLSIK